jgi:acetyltransferase-like isoleucine patch superfamily enzyme
MREVVKAAFRGAASVVVLPALVSYAVRARVVGRDRALEGSTQMLALIPGLAGQYIRRAFLARTLAGCAASAVVSFGTTFSRCGARLDEQVYIGPGCVLGLVHVERDVLVGSGVHVTSGRRTHGIDDSTTPIRDQPSLPRLVRIGAGSWIGSAAVIMADVGSNSVIGAGSVVTKPIPDSVVAAGSPARIIRNRNS